MTPAVENPPAEEEASKGMQRCIRSRNDIVKSLDRKFDSLKPFKL